MKTQVFIFSIIFSFFNVCFANRSPASDVRAEIDAAIKADSNCNSMGDFYWEIGSPTGAIASGSIGNTYSAGKELELASASKWLFGAYVFEKQKGQVSVDEKQYLNMMSGYVNMQNFLCMIAKVHTVSDCFHAQPLLPGLFKKKPGNDTQSPEDVGKYFYNGGHAQALAVQPQVGLGNMTNEALGREMQSMLKLSQPIHYTFPQLAGGGSAAPAAYIEFLKNLMTDKYYLSSVIQHDGGVCANTKYCNPPTVVKSPGPGDTNWWYGNHYWIEKDPQGKVEAYSSAGLYGFYPWMTADKKYYGIIARKGPIINAAAQSVSCGRAIREKFLSVYH